MKSCTIEIVSPEFENQYRVSRASLEKYFPTNWDHHKVVLDSDMILGLKQDYPYEDLNQFICAIRPAVVLQFLEQYDRVLFLGSDVVFYSEPTEIIENDYSEAIVVPHIVSSIPVKGELPNLQSIIKTGHINSDIVLWTNSDKIKNFLKWQSEVHKTHCISEDVIFYDQTWLNCLPFFVDDVKILRSPAYNLAYFNSKERGVKLVDNEYYVNGWEKLVCAQFSGFVPGEPERLSKHTNYTNATGDLLKLYQDYNEELKKHG